MTLEELEYKKLELEFIFASKETDMAIEKIAEGIST